MYENIIRGDCRKKRKTSVSRRHTRRYKQKKVANELNASFLRLRANGRNNSKHCCAIVAVITEQKKCWELLAETFDRFQTLRDNTQQHPTTCNRECKRTQHVTSNNVAPVCTGLKTGNLSKVLSVATPTSAVISAFKQALRLGKGG